MKNAISIKLRDLLKRGFFHCLLLHRDIQYYNFGKFCNVCKREFRDRHFCYKHNIYVIGFKKHCKNDIIQYDRNGDMTQEFKKYLVENKYAT